MVHSYQGNHILAVFKEAENYSSLRKALSDVRAEVEQLKILHHNGIDYEFNTTWEVIGNSLL